MLRTNTLKSKLGSGLPVYGLISSIPAPAAIELIAEAGFDFVIIDMEHVLINPETVENMIRVAESYDLTPLVRVADLNPKTLLRLLDGGAQGIVLPMIESPEQLADAIAACKYHPLGRRSLNAGRPGSFGKHSLAQYVEAANQQIMVVAMIESAEGVRRATEIAAVAGLDMILEGAADLSQSLGMPGRSIIPKCNKPCPTPGRPRRPQALPIAPSPGSQATLPVGRLAGSTALFSGMSAVSLFVRCKPV